MMQKQVADPSPVKRFLGKLRVRLRSLGLRIVVHFFAFLTAGFASDASAKSVFGYSQGLVIGSTYIGLVCLFSREMALKASWLIPFGSGLAQCGALLFLGSHFHVAVFFGGLQTWLQRIIQKKGENGTEWAMVFFLFMLGSSLLGHHDPFPILASFFPITLVTVVIARMCKTVEFRKVHGKKIQKSLEQLDKVCLARTFPLQIRQVSEKLAGAIRQYEQDLLKDSIETRIAIDTIADAAERLEKSPRPNDTTETLEASLERTRTSLEQALSDLSSFSRKQREAGGKDTGQNEQEKIGRAVAIKMQPFRKKAEELLWKKDQLPENMQEHVENIYHSALAIIECMSTDPKDVEPGTRFLERYLPAVQKVMDEYLRLSQGKAGHSSELTRAFDLSAELLARLDKAFAGEHEGLMQNDVLHFTAELKVLDSLLKMEGR